MREIAEAMGMGKSSLYDYFVAKDDILRFIIEEIITNLTTKAQAIAALSISPTERIEQIMALQLNYLQANDNVFWLLSNETQRLKPESQRIQQLRYAFQDLMQDIIQEGIAQGCFRQVDALLVVRLLINSLLSVLYTSRPTGSVKAMHDEAVEIILRGIQR